MKCRNCSEDTQCRAAKVYYARILDTKSNTTYQTVRKSTTTTVTTYGPVKEETVSICADCAAKLKRRKIFTRPLWALFLLAVFAFIAAVTELFSKNGMIIFLYVLGGIFILVVISSIVSLAKKSYLKASDADLYEICSDVLKKELKKTSHDTKYEFWKEYPKHLRTVNR